MGEKEIKDEVLEDLEPENGEEVKGGNLTGDAGRELRRKRQFVNSHNPRQTKGITGEV